VISNQYAMKHLVASAWTFLPMPARGISKPKLRIGGSHVSGGGNMTVDTANRLHTFAVPFTYLTATEFAILTGFRDLTGPHYYTDDNGVTTFNVLLLDLDVTVNLQTRRDCTLTLQQYQ